MFLGARSEQVNSHEVVTVLIDYEKYRNIRSFSLSSKYNETNSKVCANSDHEEYRTCSSKCVLGCRYAPSFAEVITSVDQCNGSICIEGCFCRNNLGNYLVNSILVGFSVRNLIFLDLFSFIWFKQFFICFQWDIKINVYQRLNVPHGEADQSELLQWIGI